VKAYTSLQAAYFLSQNTGRWYLLKDFKAGKGDIEVYLREDVEQILRARSARVYLMGG